RQLEAGAVAVAPGGITVQALHDVPAEVRTAKAARPHAVDLLVAVLPDVADPQVAGLPVETEAPRVAQPIRPDLRPVARLAGERVVGRDPVWLGRPGIGAHVDAQELAEQGVEALPVALRIAAGAAVAHADV